VFSLTIRQEWLKIWGTREGEYDAGGSQLP